MRLGLSIATIVAAASPLRAQEVWRVRPAVRTGLLLPARSLGETTTASVRMRQALVAAASVDVMPPRGSFGVRASGVVGVTKGARVEPTDGCLALCTVYINPSPRFVAVALDLTFRLGNRRRWLLVSAGPGLRGYGTTRIGSTAPFGVPGQLSGFIVTERLHLGQHFGLEAGHRIGRLDLGLHLEDHTAIFHRTQRRQHDLLVLVSLRWS